MKVSTSILKYLYKKASLEEFQGSHLFVRLTSFHLEIKGFTAMKASISSTDKPKVNKKF